MSNKIADLVFKLKADATQFSQELEESGKAVTKFSTDLSSGSTNSGMKLASLGATARVMGGAVLAGAAAIGTLTSAVIQNAQEVANIDKLAKNMDINTQRFLKQAMAAEQMGVSMEDYADMLKDVSERITELAEIGTGEAMDMFEKMNIDVREFQGLAPDQMFIKMAEALSTLESKQERNLYLLQIAGDTGQRLSQVTDDGGKKFLEMAEAMEKTSGIMSDEMIAESKELNDKLKATSIAVDNDLRNALISATPMVSAMADAYGDWARNVALLFDTMRDNPLTQDGLAINIAEDMAELDELQAELAELQSAKKYGFNWAKWTTNQGAIEEVKAEIAALTKVMDENQARYDRLTGKDKKPGVWKDLSDTSGQGGEKTPGTGFVKPVLNTELLAKQQQGKEMLAQLDSQYASEMQKLDIASQQRRDKILEIQLTEAEIKSRGYATLEQLQDAYLSKELANLEEQKAALKESQLANVSAGLDAMFAGEQAAGQKGLQDKSQVDQIAMQFMEEESLIAAHYDNQIAIVEAYYASIGGITSEGESLLVSIKQRAEQEKQNYQLQNAQLITSNSASMFGNLAVISEKFKGKQSGIYKAMFAASRAFAIADIGISTAQGAMRAYRENPFPLNLFAAGAVVAAGAAQLATVRQSQVSGVYHGGGFIRKEATYLLDRGETVLSPDDNLQLRQAAQNINNDAGTSKNVTFQASFNYSALTPEQGVGLIMDNRSAITGAVMQGLEEMGIALNK